MADKAGVTPPESAQAPFAPPQGLVPPPPPPPPPPSTLTPPTVGWHETQPLATPPFSTPTPALPPTLTPPSVSGLTPAPAAVAQSAEPAKKSFSAAELDHVPRYIAPDDDHLDHVSSPSQPRPISTEWQPNELASFSGAEWVPPALAHEEVAAHVAPKAVSPEPPRSPRNLTIALAGVALVAGLGFGVNKALAPDNAKVVVETTTVETTAKSATSVSTTLTTRPIQVSAAPAGADPFAPAKDSELTVPPPAVRKAQRNLIVATGQLMAVQGQYGVVVADGQLPVPGDAQTIALAVDLDPESLRKTTDILLEGTPQLIHHVAGTTTIDRLDKAQAFASGIQQAAMEKFSSDGGFVVDVWYTDESLVAVTFRSPKHPEWELTVVYPESLRPTDPMAGVIVNTGPASDAASAALAGVGATATTAPAARAPGIVGAANAAGAAEAAAAAAADSAVVEEPATTTPAP